MLVYFIIQCLSCAAGAACIHVCVLDIIQPDRQTGSLLALEPPTPNGIDS